MPALPAVNVESLPALCAGRLFCLSYARIAHARIATTGEQFARRLAHASCPMIQTGVGYSTAAGSAPSGIDPA